METTDYCDYKLSLALKECGFDEPCGKSVKIIPGTEREEWDEAECQWCTVQDIEYYPKITLWQAQKWLREKWDWHIIVEPLIWESLTYEFKLWHKFRGYENANRGFYFSSYERALSAGIAAALELIKKGE